MYGCGGAFGLLILDHWTLDMFTSVNYLRHCLLFNRVQLLEKLFIVYTLNVGNGQDR